VRIKIVTAQSIGFFLCLLVTFLSVFFLESKKSGSIIELWMLAQVLLFVILIRYLFTIRPSRIEYFFYFNLVLYFSIIALFEIFTSGASVILTFILWMVVFSGTRAFYVFVSFINDDSFKKLTGGLLVISVAVMVYGQLQSLAFIFNLPFLDQVSRFRTVSGFRQVTSVFEEPAFYGLYLIGVYFLMRTLQGKKYWLFFLLLVTQLLQTLSVGAVVGFILTHSFFVLLNKNKSSFSNGVRKSFYLLLIFPVVAYFLFKDGYFITRIQNEVFSSIQYLGSKPKITGDESSGMLRVINELNTLFYTLGNSPFFGFGFDYTDELDRPMALNGIVEFFTRFGGIGFLLFVMWLSTLYKSNKYKMTIVFVFFVISLIDGAISKIQFWFPLMYLMVLFSYQIRTSNCKIC